MFFFFVFFNSQCYSRNNYIPTLRLFTALTACGPAELSFCYRNSVLLKMRTHPAPPWGGIFLFIDSAGLSHSELLHQLNQPFFCFFFIFFFLFFCFVFYFATEIFWCCDLWKNLGLFLFFLKLQRIIYVFKCKCNVHDLKGAQDHQKLAAFP